MEKRGRSDTIEGRIFAGLRRVIRARKANPVFSGGEFQWVDSGSPQVFAFLRTHAGARALALCNFSEQVQLIQANLLRLYGLSYLFKDLLSERLVPAADLNLAAYEVVCLQAE